MALPDKDTALPIVKRIRAKYPLANPGGSPLGDDGWMAIVAVAQQFGAKVFRKEGGERVLIPALGKSVNRTIIGQGAFGNVWVKVFGDGEGTAFPIWSIGDTPADGEYLDVSGIVLPGAPPAPVPVPPSGRVAELETALRQMRDIADRVL